MNPTPPAMRRAGWALTGLVAAFLVFDGAAKLARFDPYVEGTVRLGYPDHLVQPLGAVILACTAVYLAPPTSVLGAVLLTGFLGGATATHVRVTEPFIFPVIFGALVWASLLLRDARLRALLPVRRRPTPQTDSPAFGADA